MGDQPDAAIIRASLVEPALFEDIFDRHYDTIRRFAQRRLGQWAGEEVAAQTFLVAFDRRASFRRDASARPWLLGIATNLIRHHVRDEQTHLRILGTLPPDPAPPGPDEQDRLEAVLLGPILSREFAALPAPDRDTFLLFALADLSYFEIAEALEIPAGTVRSRIHRVRLRLRERLSPVRGMDIDGTGRSR